MIFMNFANHNNFCVVLRTKCSLFWNFRFRSRLSHEFGVESKQRSLVYSGRGRPPKSIKGLGMMILPREGGAGGGDSSGDEDDGTQAAAGAEVEAGGQEDKEYSEEETDEEVSAGFYCSSFVLEF